MYEKGSSGVYVGNLFNLVGVSPVEYNVWIKAESANPDNIALWMPFTVTVPDITNDAPVYEMEPFIEDPVVSIGTITTLNGVAVDPEAYDLTYHWEQLYPFFPTGTFICWCTHRWQGFTVVAFFHSSFL